MPLLLLIILLVILLKSIFLLLQFLSHKNTTNKNYVNNNTKTIMDFTTNIITGLDSLLLNNNKKKHSGNIRAPWRNRLFLQPQVFTGSVLYYTYKRRVCCYY